MKKTLVLGSLIADVCEKKQGFVKIYDSEISIPVTLINGKKDGKTILITAGIHGCEYPGIQTAIELAREINEEEVAGNIIIIHPVNIEAFKSKVSAIVPTDKKNINREFPGDKNGSVSQQIAHFISHQCQSQADFYIDLHGGDLYELATDYVYYPGIGDDEVVSLSREIATMIDTEYMVKSSARTGAYNFAAINGTPSILIERGGRGLWSKEEVIKYKKDIKMILNYLNVIIDSNYENKKKNKVEITNAVYVDSEVDGCWYPNVLPGHRVNEGMIIGEIKDFFGNTIKSYNAKINGVVLYMTMSLSISRDEPLIAYGEI